MHRVRQEVFDPQGNVLSVVQTGALPQVRVPSTLLDHHDESRTERVPVMRQTRHKNERVLMTYIRPATIFRHNPTEGLGDEEDEK